MGRVTRKIIEEELLAAQLLLAEAKQDCNAYSAQINLLKRILKGVER